MLSPILKTTELSKSQNQLRLFSIEDNSLTSEDILNKTSKLCKIDSNPKELEELKQSLQDLKEDKKELEWKVKSLKEKLLKCEEKSHEYYEMYHKLILELKANDDYKKKLEKQNLHLKNQLEVLTRHLVKLEKRVFLKDDNQDFCEFEISGLKQNFIVNFKKINTEDSDDDISQESSEKFINLPINLKILKETAEYSSSLRSKLTVSSEIDQNHLIFHLKNQVLQ
jgi:chromosome segregation ATPase